MNEQLNRLIAEIAKLQIENEELSASSVEPEPDHKGKSSGLPWRLTGTPDEIKAIRARFKPVDRGELSVEDKAILSMRIQMMNLQAENQELLKRKRSRKLPSR